MNDDQYALETRWLHAKLAQLRDDFERAQKPYIDRLVQIESMRTTTRFVVTPAQFEDLRSQIKGTF